MTVKLIGSALFALSGLIMALSSRRFQYTRLRTTDGFISLILYIKGQIECYSRPRSEILSTLPPEIFCACNCPGGVDTLEELIEASRIYLDEESLRLVSAFACEFGGTFRDEQIRRCDYYVAALGNERARVYSSVNAKSRASGALWICACVGIIILMW